jgi:hypothetical protein
MSKNEKTARPPISHLAPFGLRMQPELRALLEAAAIRNERSMNSEITARLNESFGRSAGLGEKEIELLADILAKKLTSKK